MVENSRILSYELEKKKKTAWALESPRVIPGQWFSILPLFPWRHFWQTQVGDATGIKWGRVVPCTGQPPGEHSPAQNVNSTKVKKPCPRAKS